MPDSRKNASRFGYEAVRALEDVYTRRCKVKAAKTCPPPNKTSGKEKEVLPAVWQRRIAVERYKPEIARGPRHGPSAAKTPTQRTAPTELFQAPANFPPFWIRF